MSNGIDEAVSRMRSKVGTKRELRRLPEMLWQGEAVQELAGGYYKGGNGLIALTNRRLIVMIDGLVSKASEDFPLDKVTTVEMRSAMLSSVIIHAAGAAAIIERVEKKDCARLVDAARKLLALSSSQPSVTVVQPGPSDAAAALRTLASLRDSGAITETEFYDKKKELLARI